MTRYSLIRDILFLLYVFCVFPISANAAKPDNYQDLVQRNLELREKYQALEEKYISLENERNVLIVHIRTLQQENQGLLNPEERRRLQAEHDANVAAALDEMTKRLEVMTQEKGQLEEELARARKMYEEAKANVISTTPSVVEVPLKSKEDVASCQAKEEEWASERAELLVEINQWKSAQEELTLQSQEDVASHQAEEEEWASLRAQLLSEIDELKFVQGDLTKENRSLYKEANLLEDKKKLAAKLTKAVKAQRKLERELKGTEALKEKLESQQKIQREQKALIRKMAIEKSLLGAALARQAKTVGRKASLGPVSRRDILTPQEKKQRLEMHFNLAVAHNKMGAHRAEEQEYLQCLKIDPNDPSVHYNMGILYDDKLNDPVKAIKHYKRFLELSSDTNEIAQVKHWLLYAEEYQRIGK